ncbi:hypothetical protein NQ176_g3418 [Zarea fungicola]|uniref:Uncharacterized protein n=1 Tax=Zarea fungicola TaxID=93591 RepID=A0ACC1NLD5_9HYPO|nr:hypothetical protein NQ176_g3418 [Lecanicillium fungicola]
MTQQPVDIVFGGTRIGNRELFKPENRLNEFFAVLTAHGVATIDTAQSYGNSEETLGQTSAGDAFTIDTKWSPPSFTESSVAWATKEQIRSSAEESIRKLRVAAGIFYLHRPDPLTPIAETLWAVNEVHQRGHFERFGLSGFPPEEVEAIYHYCGEKGYPLPAIYQGSYNPLSRYKETELLPTLRRLGIGFYGYGPSAGGFLGKTVAEATDMAKTINTVSAARRPYISDAKFLEALGRWNCIAEAEGVSSAELAYRWITYHSALDRANGDAVIIGSSSPEQLKDTLDGIDKGPLSADACESIQRIWESVR